MNENTKRLANILKAAGIPAREVRVYGSQVHFETGRRNKDRAVHLMTMAGFRFRGQVNAETSMRLRKGQRAVPGLVLYFAVSQ